MQPIRSALPSKGAWQLPVLGKAAAEPVPAWLVERLQSGYLTVNSLGGLTVRDPDDHRSCVAGQSVELTADNRIEFH